MDRYFWKRNGLTFMLEKSEEEPLWGNEGTSQNVRLIVSNNKYQNLILSTSYGVDIILETIERQKKNNNKILLDNIGESYYFGKDKFYFILDRYQEEYTVLEGDDCEDFYDWLIQSLSIIEGRKLKIGKIKQKING